MVPKVAIMFVFSVVTAVRIPAAINAPMSAYSTAVTPFLSEETGFSALLIMRSMVAYFAARPAFRRAGARVAGNAPRFLPAVRGPSPRRAAPFAAVGPRGEDRVKCPGLRQHSA